MNLLRHTNIINQLRFKRYISYSYKCLADRSPHPPPKIATLTGNPENDGLHRYELDFLETAEWTQNLIEGMKSDKDLLSSKIVPFKSSIKDLPICFHYTETISYDCTVPPPINNQVKCMVQVDKLGLNPKEKHAFLLIAGHFYDPYTNIVSFTPKETVDAPFQETASLQENMNHCSKILDVMIEEAKKSMNDLSSVPLNLLHVSRNAPSLEFPKEWISNSKKEEQEELESVKC